MVRITLEDPLEDPALGSPAHEVDDKRNQCANGGMERMFFPQVIFVACENPERLGVSPLKWVVLWIYGIVDVLLLHAGRDTG